MASILAMLVGMSALAACGGIPLSSSPVAGPEITDDVDVTIGFSPQGPREGATQEEIVTNFVLAATNPQNDYGLSRSFLAADFAEEWDPDAGVSIRTGAGTPVTVSETRVDYSFRTSASVNREGQYKQERESANATLPFTFVQEDGEWRIAQAPPGIVLLEDNFAQVFREHALYFFDPSFNYLVPDLRWFPNRADISFRVVASLLTGPSAWYANGILLSAFPAGTVVGEGRVSVESGVATVDLSDVASSANERDRERMRQQLSASLSSLASVTNVALTVEGSPLGIPDSGGTAASSSLQVNPLPLVRKGNDFGFITNDEVTPIRQLSAKVIEIDGSGGALSRGGSAMAVLANGNVWAVRPGRVEPLRVDERGGLAVPSIDTFGFIWSAPRSSARAIQVFSLDGERKEVQTNLPADARVLSIDVSRDGARILLYLSTAGGPRLLMAGISRLESIPVSLGELVDLPVGGATPIDATWVDDRTVATLSGSGDDTTVSTWMIGGPSENLGNVPDGSAIVGGNGGEDGLRVLTDSGELFYPRGTVWQGTGNSGSFVATQQ
ncbi:GerMN domain-containing protein [Glaciihabitans arcticus]|nr:LpqB family beta-propeller domain-containing protein [Glaciihabitans arcticus]